MSIFWKQRERERERDWYEENKRRLKEGDIFLQEMHFSSQFKLREKYKHVAHMCGDDVMWANGVWEKEEFKSILNLYFDISVLYNLYIKPCTRTDTNIYICNNSLLSGKNIKK